MKWKKIFLLMITIILASSAYYFYHLIKTEKISIFSKNKNDYSEKNAIGVKDTIDSVDPIEENLTSEGIGGGESQESKDSVSGVKKETQTKTMVIAEIKCSLKAKDGSKSKLAKVSWNCENYLNWSCRLRNNIKTLIDNVKLPVDTQEVEAETATMKRDHPCRSVREPYYHWDCPPMTTHPGYNDYSLKCSSSEGKIENFHKLYINYNH